MVRSVFAAIALVAGVSSADRPSVAEKKVPAPEKQYKVSLRVCEGDPLGSRRQGVLKSWTDTSLVALEGVPAYIKSGGELTAFDSASADFIGVEIRVRALKEEDGMIRLEIACRVSKLVNASDDHSHEIHAYFVRETCEVHDGETIKLRLKAFSPTNQIWLEATPEILHPLPGT